MKIMTYGDIEHVDRVVAEKLDVVRGLTRHARYLVEPVQGGWIDVADRGELRTYRMINERRPALERRGDFPSHEAAAHDRDVHDLGHCAPPTNRRASSTLAFSWSTAISARVIPDGFSCCTTFRPYTMPRAPWASTAAVRSSRVRSSTRPPPRTRTGTSPATSITW